MLLNILKSISTTVVLFVCLVPVTLQAGGGEWYSPFYADNGFNILNKAMVKTYIKRSNSLSPHHFNSEEYHEKRATKKYNLEAWAAYLKTTPTIAEQIVYKHQQDNEKLDVVISPSVQRYLDIVQQQEEVVSSGLSQWIPKDKKQAAIEQRQLSRNTAIEAATKQLKTEKDPFLKQRYVYLLLRLTHYSARHSEVVSLYKQYNNAIQTPNKEVTHWINLLHAGALQHLGQKAESAYLFATTFSQTKTKRLQAQINFKITTDEEWESLLALCKNDDEKALMHFMRAIRSNANSIQELETIYSIAPNSQWFDNLLIRELEFVQFARKKGLGFQANGPERASINNQVLIDSVDAKVPQTQRRTDYLEQLSGFVTQVQQDKKRSDLFLTDYAGLYLKLLSAQTIVMSDVHGFQKKYAEDSRVPYSKGLEHFVYLENLDAIDAAAEMVISENITAIEALDKDADGKPIFNNDIMVYTYIKLESLYLKVKEPGKYYIAKTRGDMDQDEILVGELRGIQALQKKASPNLLEQRILQAFGQWSEQDIDKMIARKYLSAGLLAKAEEVLDKSDSVSVIETQYNPFFSGLSGNNRSKKTFMGLRSDDSGFSKKTYTQAEVIGIMSTLTEAINDDPSNAENHFRLGTVYYNMTWFGNSPSLVRAYRSSISWHNGEVDFTKARQHFEKVLTLTDDRDMKAMTLYTLAKIEENELYIKNGFRSWRYKAYSNSYADAVQENKKLGLGRYFKQLKAYEDTQYSKEVIQQCADYRYYF